MRKQHAFVLGLMSAVLAGAAWANVTDTISFKATVNSEKTTELAKADPDENLRDSAQNVEFRLYDSATSTNTLWARKITVAVDSNLVFYVDLKDTEGNLIAGAAKQKLVDALDVCARTSSSVWVGWTFPGATEAPRLELVRYPWAFMTNKAKTVGKAKCTAVTAMDLKVTNGASATNRIYKLTTDELIKNDVKLKMVTTDAIISSFILTGGINGFRQVAESGDEKERIDLKTEMVNDTMVLRSHTISGISGLKTISVRAVPYDTKLANDRSENLGFIQTLGAANDK